MGCDRRDIRERQTQVIPAADREQQQVYDNTTIFALSSGRPPAAIAVVRLSGVRAFAALSTLTGRNRFIPRRATRARLTSRSGIAIDEAIVLCFPAPASFTGEDVAEIHVTGGAAVVSALLTELGSLAGLRLAAPGEFARRAFEAGKIDLTEAEGLADLIEAQSEAQRIQALRQASGGLKDLAERWQAALLSALAETEAMLDFSEDEEDVALQIAGERASVPLRIACEIEQHLSGYTFAERLRRGVGIVVTGAPNIGKSSLVNALAKREVAIVSPEAGTTRDPIEVHLSLAGVPAILVDTAGLRVATAPVESEGIRRARSRIAEADIVLQLIAPGENADAGAMAIVTKADTRIARCVGGLDVSVATGEGLETLREALCRRAAALTGSGEDLLVTHERQRASLADCSAALAEAARESDPVLHAESLRTALRALGALTGQVSVERILDVIFSRFCIGK